MPFWKFAVVVIVLATFTATLSHRLLETNYVPVSEETIITATVAAGPERWFVTPPLLRPEEGSCELPMLDDGIRPAYAIATILYVFALISIFSDGWLTHQLSLWATDFPAVKSVALVVATMTSYHAQRLVRGADTRE